MVVCTFLLLWIFLGYDLFLSLLSRLIGKPWKREDKYAPAISIVVPVFNGERHVEQKIVNSLKLEYPGEKEVILVDDGSNDRTYEIARDYPIKIIRHNTRQGKTKCINAALRMSTFDIILVTDVDCTLENKALIEVAKNFYDPSIVVVCPMYKTDGPEQTFANAENRRNVKESLIGSMATARGDAIFFRKSVFPEIPDSVVTEDLYLTIESVKRGYRAIVGENTFFYESSPTKIRDYVRQKKNRTLITMLTLMNNGKVVFNPKYGIYSMLILPSHRILPVLSPMLFVLLAMDIFLSLNNHVLPFFILITLFLIGIVSIYHKMNLPKAFFLYFLMQIAVSMAIVDFLKILFRGIKVIDLTGKTGAILLSRAK